MNIFIEWMAPIAAICIGIIVLAVFFSLLGAIKNRFSSVKYLKFKKILKDADLVTVHLSSGKSVSGVRLVGFTDASSLKGIPYPLTNMALCETPEGRKFLIRADTIRMLEQQETQHTEITT
jgi:hypothetical protein